MGGIIMWIARDFDGSLWLYSDKPYKDDFRWRLPIGNGCCQSLLDYLFPEIRWEDEEPRELILK